MENKTSKFILGCTVAPLTVPVMLLIIILITGTDMRGPGYEYRLADYSELLGIVGMFIVLGAPIAYVIMLVFGVPAYLAAKHYGYINFWSVTVGSSLVAIMPILIMSAKNGFVLYDNRAINSLLFYLTFAFAGYVAGLVFWFVSGLNSQKAYNNSSNLTGADNASSS